MAVTLEQVLPIANVLVPLIVNYVRTRRDAGQDVPAEGTPEFDDYMHELNAHVLQRADSVVAEIEQMQRAHPRTP